VGLQYSLHKSDLQSSDKNVIEPSWLASLIVTGGGCCVSQWITAARRDRPVGLMVEESLSFGILCQNRQALHNRMPAQLGRYALGSLQESKITVFIAGKREDLLQDLDRNGINADFTSVFGTTGARS
jgi:hypothetical protein